MAECTDKNCYVHGTINVRGRTALGKVISAKAKSSVVVERAVTKFFPKYRRWAQGRSRTMAHNPACINAALGDMVRIGETRKISKRKAWTVLEVVKGEIKAK